MPYIAFTVDGQSLMAGRTEHIGQLPPEILKRLHPGAKAEPWMKAALFEIVDAVGNGQDAHITIDTRPQGWTMTTYRPSNEVIDDDAG